MYGKGFFCIEYVGLMKMILLIMDLLINFVTFFFWFLLVVIKNENLLLVLM